LRVVIKANEVTNKDEADSAVTEFLSVMDRVTAMIFSREADPLHVILLLQDARALLQRADGELRDVKSNEHIRLRTALPNMRWKLEQLEQAAKLAEPAKTAQLDQDQESRSLSGGGAGVS